MGGRGGKRAHGLTWFNLKSVILVISGAAVAVGAAGGAVLSGLFICGQSG